MLAGDRFRLPKCDESENNVVIIMCAVDYLSWHGRMGYVQLNMSTNRYQS